MADDKNKEYSTQEVVEMLKNLTSAVSSGNYQNLTIGAPMDASSYDAVAANANGMLQTYIGRYTNEMLRMQRLQRQNAVATAMGAGSMGGALLGQLAQIAPGIGNSLMGLHGIDEAQQIMLMNANGMGRPMGGVMNPAQMASNVRWAATQGSMALSNAFNKDGSVNGRFTSGLSLPQTAVVGSSIISDQSQRAEWERKELARTRAWKEAHQGATAEEMTKAGIMSESQITGFKNGTSLTSEAVKSFNDHIKNFQKEMNGFVASVSKITGSFDSAIDFIQDMTNGKAFSAGRQAGEMRDKAMQMASNLRIMAADSGMDAKTLYSMMYNPQGGLGNRFDLARGKDIIASRVGDRSVTGNMAALSAGAIAQWKKAHPNATQEQMADAEARINTRVENFAQGDADEHNVLLAEAVRNGDISEEEARKLAASGNQESVYNRLKQIYGQDVDSILTDSVFMENISKRNSSMVNNLNTLSFNKGYSRESAMFNQRNAMGMSKNMLQGKLSASLGKDVSADVERLHRESLLDEGVLKAAGLSEDQIADIREKGKDWDSNTLHEYLVSEMGASEWALNKGSASLMGSRLKDKFGGRNAAADRAIRQFNETNAGVNQEATKEDLAKYAAAKKAGQIDAGRNALKEKYYKALNSGKKDAAAEADAVMSELNAMADKAAAGEDGMAIGGTDFVGYMLDQTLGGIGLDVEKASELRSLGMGKFRAGIGEGKSFDEALQSAYTAMHDKDSRIGKPKSSFANPEQRKKMMAQYRQSEAANVLFSKLVDASGMTEADKEKAKRQFLNDLQRQGSNFGQFEKGGEKLTGADRDRYIAKQLVEKLGSTEDMKKAGLGSEEIGKYTSSREAFDTMNDVMMRSYKMVTGDQGALAKTVDISSLTDKEVQDAEMIKAMGNDANYNSVRSQYSTGEDVSAAVENSATAMGAATKEETAYHDGRQADAANTPFGRIRAEDRAVIEGKLGVSAKMNNLREMFTGRKGSWWGGGHRSVMDMVNENIKKGTWKPKDYDGTVSKEFVAGTLQKFLNAHANDDEKSFNEALLNDVDIGRLGEDVRDLFIGQEDDNGEKISSRYKIQALVSGLRVKDGENLDDAMRNGFMASAVGAGDEKIAQIESVQLQRAMLASLNQIAGNTAEMKK